MFLGTVGGRTPGLDLDFVGVAVVAVVVVVVVVAVAAVAAAAVAGADGEVASDGLAPVCWGEP